MNPAQPFLAQRCADTSTESGYLCLPCVGNSSVRAVVSRGYSPDVIALTFDDASVLHMQQSRRCTRFCWNPPDNYLHNTLLAAEARERCTRTLQYEHSYQRRDLRRLATIEQMLSNCDLPEAAELNLILERKAILAGYNLHTTVAKISS